MIDRSLILFNQRVADTEYAQSKAASEVGFMKAVCNVSGTFQESICEPWLLCNIG